MLSLIRLKPERLINEGRLTIDIPRMVRKKGLKFAQIQKLYIIALVQLFLGSSTVEHPAVNRQVVGSNPSRGAFFM